MKPLMTKTVAALAILLVLSACSSGPRLRDADRLALYSANAGAPVKDFHYFGSINGWTPLGDDALVVWTRPNQAYLLGLIGRCPGLEYAQAITVSNQFGRVHARFDSVTALGSGATHRIPCRIEQIRPIDVTALKQMQGEMRESVETTERARDQATQEPGGT